MSARHRLPLRHTVHPGRRSFGRIRLRTLILLRWITVCGQTTAILVTAVIADATLPLAQCLAVVAVSALVNLAAIWQRRGQLRLGDRDAAIYIGYDLVQLSVLLFLTGGLLNPFSVLLLAPLTISATALSRKITATLTGLTITCISVLALWHYPLPAVGAGLEAASFTYNLGLWMALTLSAAIIASYVWRVAEEARRLSDAVAASQMALAREQRVSALGALAAAAAHELSTPLGTIAVAATEVRRDLPPDSPEALDIELIRDEAQRCREILAELARRPEATGNGNAFDVLPLAALVDEAAGPHRDPAVTIDVSMTPRDASKPPMLPRSPELMHGVGNLLQNAIQYARRRVDVRGEWSRHEVRLAIIDDGPGFAPGLLQRLGEPYLSGRPAETAGKGHMGLGIFIASTLLEREGAQLSFLNAGHGGAQVMIRWPRPLRSETEERSTWWR